MEELQKLIDQASLEPNKLQPNSYWIEQLNNILDKELNNYSEVSKDEIAQILSAMDLPSGKDYKDMKLTIPKYSKIIIANDNDNIPITKSITHFTTNLCNEIEEPMTEENIKKSLDNASESLDDYINNVVKFGDKQRLKNEYILNHTGIINKEL